MQNFGGKVCYEKFI